MNPEDGEDGTNLPAVVEVVEGEIVEPGVGLGVSTLGPERDLLEAALRSLPSAATRKTYESHWRHFAAYFGAKPGPFIHTLMQRHKADALDMVHEYGAHMEREGKAVSTIASHLNAISSMIDRWYRAEVFPWTLKKLISIPKPNTYEDVTGTPPEDVVEMLAVTRATGTAESTRDHAILLLLHDAALRCRELYTADILHWSLSKRTISVWAKGKARGVRDKVPVSPRAARAIERWLDARGRGPGPLFCRMPIGDYPTRMNGDNVAYVVKRAARSAGVKERVSPHRLRHAGITFLARKGVAPDELRRFARHTNFNTTLIYIHTAEDAIRTLTEAFEDEDLNDQ